MRPRKIIVYVSDKENDLSIAKFMLETNGFRVLTARYLHEAVGHVKDYMVDLVLVDYEMKPFDGAKVVQKLKQIAPYIPMILLGDPVKMGDKIHSGDALLAKKSVSAAELLERIKVMSARKRGPRKGSAAAMRCGARQKPVARETVAPAVRTVG